VWTAAAFYSEQQAGSGGTKSFFAHRFPRRFFNRSTVMMENHAAAQKVLREAQLYGYLVARQGMLCHPRSGDALCDSEISSQIVRSGWLKFRSGDTITPEGVRALAAIESRSQDDTAPHRR
jgi:hypothetical protein